MFFILFKKLKGQYWNLTYSFRFKISDVSIRFARFTMRHMYFFQG